MLAPAKGTQRSTRSAPRTQQDRTRRHGHTAHKLRSLEQVMESFSSSVSPVPSFEDVFSHNMWNPLLELIVHEQVSSVFGSCVDEIDLAKIALSCHFALDLLCFKEFAYDSTGGSIGHHCPWSFFVMCGTVATLVTSWSLNLWYLVHSSSLRQL